MPILFNLRYILSLCLLLLVLFWVRSLVLFKLLDLRHVVDVVRLNLVDCEEVLVWGIDHFQIVSHDLYLANF